MKTRTMPLIKIAAMLAMLPSACTRQATAVLEDAGPAAATPTLPASYRDVHLGMSEAELRALFPPVEDVGKCTPQLVGGDIPLPIQVPGAEKKARARCLRAVDIAGMTAGELRAEDEWMTGTVKDGASRSGRDPADYREGSRYALAQVRGSIRAGTLAEAVLLEANRGKSTTAYGAVIGVADALYNGASEYARATNARRTLCALLNDSCDDLDPSRVRTYETGGYGLGQIDADAHSRVVYGKCRGPYQQGEKKLQMKLVRRAGGLAGYGLARASTADHTVNPDDATSYAVYSSRSKLEHPVAKLGVIIGNALPQTEHFWEGAIALLGPEGASESSWGTALAWVRDGHVVRVMVNIVDDTKLGELPAALASVYSSPGSTIGTVTTWQLKDGAEARLDIGAALSLTIDTAAARQAQATPAPAPPVPLVTATANATAATTAPAPASPPAGKPDRRGSGPAPAAPATADPFGTAEPATAEPAPKKKGNCNCAAGDTMCAMRCASH